MAIANPGRRQMLQKLNNDSLTINSLAQNFSMSRPGLYTPLRRFQYIASVDQLLRWFWLSKLQKLKKMLN